MYLGPPRSPSGTEKFTPTDQFVYCPGFVDRSSPLGMTPVRPFHWYCATAFSCGKVWSLAWISRTWSASVMSFNSMMSGATLFGKVHQGIPVRLQAAAGRCGHGHDLPVVVRRQTKDVSQRSFAREDVRLGRDQVRTELAVGHPGLGHGRQVAQAGSRGRFAVDASWDCCT